MYFQPLAFVAAAQMNVFSAGFASDVAMLAIANMLHRGWVQVYCIIHAHISCPYHESLYRAGRRHLLVLAACCQGASFFHVRTSVVHSSSLGSMETAVLSAARSLLLVVALTTIFRGPSKRMPIKALGEKKGPLCIRQCTGI
jgi:hypothetical protein